MRRPRNSPALLIAVGLLSDLGCKGSKEELTIDPAVEAARSRGRELFFGRAGCGECHMVGGQGTKVRGPNLGASGDYEQPVVVRAKDNRSEIDPMEYLVESILDPDAFIVKTYVKGVMKRPDEPPIALSDDEVVDLAAYLAGVGVDQPVTAAQLDRARAYIEPAKTARKESRERKLADQALGRIDWDTADPANGDVLYKELGCGRCHDDPNAEVPAPPLAEIGKRLPRAEIVRWIIAPPETRMPSYAESLSDDALRDLTASLVE